MAVALDRGKVSGRAAALVIPAVSSIFGQNIASTSYSTIKGHRQKTQQNILTKVKSSFNHEVPLTIHWDGKLFTDQKSSYILLIKFKTLLLNDFIILLI